MRNARKSTTQERTKDLDKKLAVINIIFAIGDVIVCLAFVMALAKAAVYFNKWWILLFSLIPLLLYSAHGIILEQKGSVDDAP